MFNSMTPIPIRLGALYPLCAKASQRKCPRAMTSSFAMQFKLDLQSVHKSGIEWRIASHTYSREYRVG